MAHIKSEPFFMTPLSIHLRDWVFLKKNKWEMGVLTRVDHLVLLPATCIIGALDAIVGVGAGIAAIATGGKVPSILSFAWTYGNASSRLVSRVYFHALGILNPRAPIRGIPSEGKGGFRDHFIEWVIQKNPLFKYTNSSHFLERHVVARAGSALLGITCVVADVADGVIGLVAAAFSFLTLGRNFTVNTIACIELRGSARVVSDLLLIGGVQTINPFLQLRRKQ